MIAGQERFEESVELEMSPWAKIAQALESRIYGVCPLPQTSEGGLNIIDYCTDCISIAEENGLERQCVNGHALSSALLPD